MSSAFFTVSGCFIDQTAHLLMETTNPLITIITGTAWKTDANVCLDIQNCERINYWLIKTAVVSLTVKMSWENMLAFGTTGLQVVSNRLPDLLSPLFFSDAVELLASAGLCQLSLECPCHSRSGQSLNVALSWNSQISCREALFH